MPPPRIPLSTYRLQFNGDLTFARAAAIVPYLHALGITQCYASSFLKAMPGSMHGYDIIDPSSLNPEVGTEEELQSFVNALHERGMGIVLDIVPNHMGIGKALNPWWRDVLEHGPSSRYADAFDIDWRPIKRELQDKVLLPILGDQYGTVLENQDITVAYEDGQLSVRYFEFDLPLTPHSWIRILAHRLEDLVKQAEAGAAAESDVMELQSIVTAIRNLPGTDERDPARIEERYREKEVIKKRLAALTEASEPVRTFVLENVRIFNGERGRSESFDLLDSLLDEQVYRLASWQVASEEINYRRFFDINELAAVRMENPNVFREAHQLVFRLVREGAVNGLRIDHVDGLYDPGRYVAELQAWAGREVDRASEERPLFIVVEKILGHDEVLPDAWPVHGTTGYDFMHVVDGLFIQGVHERAFTDLYHRTIGREEAYPDVVYASKRLIMRASMASEINVLGHQLNLISERDRRSRDFTLNSLTHAIREIIACFPVYRTYATDGPGPVAERDRAYIHMAVARAKRRNPTLAGQVFDFIRSILLKQSDARTAQDREEQLRFVMKFQQTTSPVTAKGVEDTAFYRYNRLIALNEVGGDPEQFGLSLEEFHKRMRERQARWPHSLSASTTHDTKRSEDVRARLAVLSELPQEWRTRVGKWSRINRKHRGDAEGERLPDRNDEYVFYQTLVGVWPVQPMGDEAYRVLCERIERYMEKAIREAKVHTSWTNANPVYEHAMRDFVRAVLDRSRSHAFFDDFLPFQERIAHYGLFTSLSQLLVKLTAPGIPDFYQGTELWNFSLVDPDNRRPVDYGVRAACVQDLETVVALDGPERGDQVRAWAQHPRDGLLKLYLIMAGLHYRRREPGLFQAGDYLPLEAGGAKKQHVCAFARTLDDRAVMAVVPRWLATLTPDDKNPPIGAALWEDNWVAVPPWPSLAPYRNVLTGDVIGAESVSGRRVLPLARVFQDCPVALLERLA